MATTFSDNYQIKLIGTGLEAGTWGTSTNENFKRIEQALGGSTTSFNIINPPGASSYSSNTLTWRVGDNYDSDESGSEGRNRFINFVNLITELSITQTVKIRGNSATDLVDRIYFVRNSLTEAVGMKFIMNSTATAASVVVPHNCSAVIYSNASADEVGNLLGTIMLEGINFPVQADITIENNDAGSLEIKDSSQTYFALDTQSTSVATITATETKIVSANTTVGLTDAEATIRSSGDGDMTLKTGNSTTGSITIVDDTAGDILLKNDTTGKVMVGSSGHVGTISSNGAYNLKLETNDGGTSGTIEITTGANGAITLTPNGTGSVVMTKVDIASGEIDGTVIGENSAAAITGAAILGSTVTSGAADATGVFSSNGDGDVQLKTGNTTTGTITITEGSNGAIALTPDGTGVVTVATDLQVLTDNGYLNFGTPVGSSGIGIRNNVGTVEMRSHTSESWGIPWMSTAVSGQGSYFESSPEELSAGEYFEKPHGFISATFSLPDDPISSQGAGNTLATITEPGYSGIVAGETVVFYGVTGDPIGILDAVWNRAEGHEIWFPFDADTYYIYLPTNTSAGTGGGAAVTRSVGQVPRIVMSSMKCTIADGDYSIGDEISLGWGGLTSTSPSADKGIMSGANSIFVFSQAASGATFWSGLEKDTGDHEDFVEASWRLIIRAWK